MIACEARTTESLYCSGEYAPRSAIDRAGADCLVDTKLVLLWTVEIGRMPRCCPVRSVPSSHERPVADTPPAELRHLAVVSRRVQSDTDGSGMPRLKPAGVTAGQVSPHITE